MHISIENEVRAARDFGSRIEELVVARGHCPTGGRITPLMAYWSLAFEFHKAILCMIANGYYAGAFALQRSLIETVIRSHLVICAGDDLLKQILDDEYRTNFATVGKEIDTAFGMEGLMERFLADARSALHGYTHVGLHQLARRFSGLDLLPNYSNEEIKEVIRTSTSALFMLNNLVTKHLGFEEEWAENAKLFETWGKRSN